MRFLVICSLFLHLTGCAMYTPHDWTGFDERSALQQQKNLESLTEFIQLHRK